MSAMLNEDSVTVAQAANRLGVSAQTIWRWIEQGKLPAYRVGDKRVRIKNDDLGKVITPITPDRKPTAMTQGDRLALGPLTPDEKERALAAIAAARALQKEMLAQRKGKLFGESDEVLNALRDERSKREQ